MQAAVGKHQAAIDLYDVGRLCLEASKASRSGEQPRKRPRYAKPSYEPRCAWEEWGREPQNIASQALESTGDTTPVDQIVRRKSTGEKTQVTEHGSQERGLAGPQAGQTRGQMEPLHLAMMRALWIWRTHEMRLMASCNQAARACWSSGATLARNALFKGGARSSVSFEDGQGDDCGSVFRALLAFGDGGDFAH